ncbi:MAG: ATP-binding protein, partial [Gaiella sp.]
LEQLLPDVARPLAELLAAAPALRLLVTSREPVRIAGESQLDLPPLGEEDAVILFLERAQAIRPDVVDTPAVHELARRLDGLPLALELAAARVKLLGPEQVLERIGQRLDLLKGGRDADERHATLRATIAWSHDLLDDRERELFARLAIFRGGCPLDDAEAVCDADLDTLASLLDKSLVRRRVDPDGVERFWMLETIREFARERLDESGEEDALRRRQADRLIDLADRAGTRAVIDAPRAWSFDLVAPQIDNVRAVLDWALDHDPHRGLRLATWLEAFWVVRDPFEGATWLERLIARTPTADRELRAAACRSLAGTLDIVGEPERAAPWYQESLTLFTACGAEIDAAHLRFRIGANAFNRGDSDTAWPAIERSLVEQRRLGVRAGECQALGYLGLKAREEGDPEGALALALESAEIAREVSWAWWEAHQLADAADLERLLGRLDAAGQHARRALELCLELGDRLGLVFAAAELATIAAAKRDAGRAGRLWGALESEAEAGRVGQWEQNRAEFEAAVLAVDGPEFSRARVEGRLLSIAEAAGLAPAQTEP